MVLKMDTSSQRIHDVIDNVICTSKRRHFDVIGTLLKRHVSTGIARPGGFNAFKSELCCSFVFDKLYAIMCDIGL